MNPIKLRSFLLSFVLFTFFTSCSERRGKDAPEADEPNTENRELSGEQLSHLMCSSCHLYPEPDLLDKKSWREGVLPQMAYRFGIYNDKSRDSLVEKGVGGEIVNSAGVFPARPVISSEKWERIRRFYIDNAPDSMSAVPENRIKKKLTAFRAIVPGIKSGRALTTAARYDSYSKNFYIAGSKGENSALYILDSQLKPLNELGLPHPISNISFRADTIMILMMGHFVPSDEPAGSLIKAFKGPGNSGFEGGGFIPVLTRLQRPVDVAYSDLDGDGDEDIVVCEFGNHTGSFSLFLNEGRRKYDKRVLNRNPGAIKVVIRDMNNDSLEDIVVLMSQGDEGIDIFYNRGNAQFEKERVLRFSPVHGSTSFSLADFNNDGHSDILYVNGDNADYSPVTKPYHGIRIFLNDGSNHFNEAYFFPQPGAYGAVARDFDEDGDIDIATISFFPDFFKSPEGGFVYLENISNGGDFKFTPSTFAGSEKGRWITMNVSDIDNDGDEDLVLGSFTGMQIVNDKDGTLLRKIAQESPMFIVLENTARQ